MPVTPPTAPHFEYLEFTDHLKCCICLDPMDDAVELSPCTHMFCRQCCASLQRCPICRGEIRGRVEPNRAIRNMLSELPVMCSHCGWRGTRESKRTHTVCPLASAASGVSAGGSSERRTLSGAPIEQQQQPGGVPSRRPSPRVISSSGHPAPWKLYGLSQVDYDQIITIFMTFDEDDSGVLDREELTKLARWMNFAQQQGDIDRMFREMDTDRSGTLTMAEFCTWLMVNKPDPTALYGLSQSEYNIVMFQFHKFDRNQDGCLNQEEFQQLCRALKYANPEQAISIFRAIDLDDNGTVDLNEYLLYRAREQRK